MFMKCFGLFLSQVPDFHNEKVMEGVHYQAVSSTGYFADQAI